jgi:hypothetical protein
MSLAAVVVLFTSFCKQNCEKGKSATKLWVQPGSPDPNTMNVDPHVGAAKLANWKNFGQNLGNIFSCKMIERKVHLISHAGERIS